MRALCLRRTAPKGESLKLGFAKRDITPDFSVPMAGYLVNRMSEGVHDKLYARALAFSGIPPADGSKSNTTVLLQLDLLNLDKLCMEKLRDGISPMGLKKEQLLVCPIHTHSGFGGIFDTEQGINRELLPLLGAPDNRLVDLVVSKSLEAIEEALKGKVDATVRMSRGSLEGFGTNRHGKDLPCDDSLFIIELYRIDGKKVLLYNLCCHPTVLNGKNLQLSADFAGAAAAKLEGVSFGGYDLALFINGSAGDMSTRFTRNDSSFAECDRYADMIIEKIRALKKGVYLPLEKVQLQYHELSLHRAEVSDVESAELNLETSKQRLEELSLLKGSGSAEIRRAESFVEGAQIKLLKAKCADNENADKKSKIPVETGILRINNQVIVCSPFELFSTLALLLKKEKDVEMFGYVNELHGYLADREAYDSMEYEALSSEFKAGEGERYIELVSALV
jgi:hypothetical protein